MTKDQLAQEKNYHISMSISKALLSQGLLTDDEFKQIKELLLEKYCPIISSL
ncbi:hypothetical protein Q5O24_07015 [Eubacteriaceae bacterium ES3]|nr:hypothetical protein Q5O24_07015 [Eubacteriaceae bacterium ES3]